MAAVYEENEAIPQGQAHNDAVALIMGGLALMDVQGPGRIVGALMYGSDSADPRSDRDFYVVYEETSTSDALEARINQLVADVYRQTHVRIDMHATSLVQVELQQDEIAKDVLFAAYMIQAAADAPPGYRFGNPAAGLRSLKRRGARLVPMAIQNVGEYASHKRRQFLDALARDELDVKALQRALELPQALGRKLLMMYAILDDGANAQAPSKRGPVLARLMELHGDDPAWKRPLEALAEHDAAYSRLLERKIREDITPGEYAAALRAQQRDVLYSAFDLAYVVGQEAVRLALEHGAKI